MKNDQCNTFNCSTSAWHDKKGANPQTHCRLVDEPFDIKVISAEASVMKLDKNREAMKELNNAGVFSQAPKQQLSRRSRRYIVVLFVLYVASIYLWTNQKAHNTQIHKIKFNYVWGRLEIEDNDNLVLTNYWMQLSGCNTDKLYFAPCIHLFTKLSCHCANLLRFYWCTKRLITV